MDSGREWAAAMRAGDFERAWRISDMLIPENVRSTAGLKHTGPRHLQRIWRGEPLAGASVLVRCYHGLGDTLQFVRFVKPLRRIAREVVVWCQPELVGFLSQCPDIDHILPLHDGTPEVAFDVDIEIMELPHALRVSAADLEQVPYLLAPAEPFGDAGPALRVGLVWQAGSWDDRRSISEQELRPLLDVAGVQYHALHPDAKISHGAMVSSAVASIEQLASRMRSLDLIVSVDTMAAHLAGAVGCPTWIVLHRDADWRWGSGDHTVWYPTVRLFRQAVAGQWSAPLEAMAESLRAMVRQRT